MVRTQQTLQYGQRPINYLPPTIPTEDNIAPTTPIYQPPLIQHTQPILTFDTNTQSNHAWGDNIHNKPKKTFRLYFQNVNGIQPRKTERWSNILQSIFPTYKADIAGLCETGINWHNPLLRNKLKTTSKYKLKTQIHLHHSFNLADSYTNFLPGGTLHMTQGHWVGRRMLELNDPHSMGRWSGTQYRLQEGKTMYVISAYRACITQRKDLAQSNSTYAQQYFMIQKQRKISLPDPRLQFIIDLTSFIKSLRAKTTDIIILMLDANEVLGTDKQGLTQLLQDTGLVDIFSIHKSEQCTIPTYNGGQHRIDYIFGSPNLIPHISQCGYLSFQQDIESDHRGMFLDIHEGLLDRNVNLQGPKPREIGTHSKTKAVEMYKDYILNHFQQNNIEERARQLYNLSIDVPPHRKERLLRDLNTIDKQVTEILLSAEKKFGSDPTKPLIMNNHIQQLQHIVRYWKVFISGQQNKRNMETILKQIQESVDPELHTHITSYQTKPKAGLHQAYQRLLKAKAESIVTMKIMEELEHTKIAEAENSTAEQIAAKRTRLSKSKLIYNQLRSRFKNQHSGGLSSILVQSDAMDPQSPVKLITNPNEVEHLLLQRNITHFGQSQGTPFTTTPIIEQLGYQGTTDNIDKINTINIQQITTPSTPSVTAILNHLNNGFNLSKISSIIRL